MKYLFIILLFASCKQPVLVVEDVKALDNYPSGSALEASDGKIFLMGDDANSILVLNHNLEIIDQVPVFNFEGKRINKEEKADPEAAAVVSVNKKKMLMIIGSGSVPPQRSFGWLVDPGTSDTSVFFLGTFYDRLKTSGIKELNIEGLTAIQGGLLMSNRGNQSNRRNHLIFVKNGFWTDQDSTEFHVAGIGVGNEIFGGVSGLDYSFASDKLLVTVSTELTSNAYTDGAIGKSYLWVVNDITSKRGYEGINISIEIDLEKMDKRFKGQKIESVCILSETRKEMNLLLVADDDKGGSMLFKVRLKI